MRQKIASLKVGWPRAVKSEKFWNIFERNYLGPQDQLPIQTVKPEFLTWLSHFAKGSQKHENRKERIESGQLGTLYKVRELLRAIGSTHL